MKHELMFNIWIWLTMANQCKSLVTMLSLDTKPYHVTNHLSASCGGGAAYSPRGDEKVMDCSGLSTSSIAGAGYWSNWAVLQCSKGQGARRTGADQRLELLPLDLTEATTVLLVTYQLERVLVIPHISRCWIYHHHAYEKPITQALNESWIVMVNVRCRIHGGGAVKSCFLSESFTHAICWIWLTIAISVFVDKDSVGIVLYQ